MAGLPDPGGGGAGLGDSPVPNVTGMEDTGINANINVTPMIDVMLVLLIIFMVVTPILASYEAVLPEAENVVPEKQDDVITLGISAQGEYYINNEPVPPGQLRERLRQMYALRPFDHLLYLKADRGVGYDVVLDAINAARAAGVRTIGAITQPVTAPDQPEQAAASPARAGELAATTDPGRF